MNSDNIFESDFLQENKGFIIVIATISLAFITIFWLFKGLTNQTQDARNETNDQTSVKPVSKKRLTVFANDILFETGTYNLKLPFAYEFLDELAKNYNLFIIIFISNNDDTSKILKEFSPIIEDKLVEEHKVLFTTNIEEGVSAFIRSIDPFAHIETNVVVIQKMIRFVNEFWLFAFGNSINLENLLKENYNFVSKIKMYNEPKEFLENLIEKNKKIKNKNQ